MKTNLFCLAIFFILYNTPAQSQNGWRSDEMEITVQINGNEEAEILRSLKLNGDIYESQGYALMYVIPKELEQIKNKGLLYEIQKHDLKAYYSNYWETKVPPGYFTYTEIINKMDSLVNAFPDICKKYSFGTSLQGRQLAALKISDNVEIDEPEPEIFFDSGIHGDEIGGPQNVIYFARDLCIEYQTDTIIEDLINNREIWLYVMVNPDGRVNMTRYNNNGVDLNRDWGYMWDAWGGSSGPYSQVESKALRDCMYNNQFVVHTTYHSGTEYISCPWSYRSQQPPDFSHILQLAGVYASSSLYTNIDYGQGNSGMYAINGSTKDGNYGVMGAISWSMEISYDKQPPASQIMPYYNKNKPAMLEMIRLSGYGLQGFVLDSLSSEPISAAIFVDDYFPTYSDSTAGDFHKYVLPGTYDITVVANGYQPKTINGVSVVSDSASTVYFYLSPLDSLVTYVYKVAASQIPGNNEGDEGLTFNAIGPPNDLNYSIGKNGWVVLDMQYPIIDGEGNDIRIIEGDMTAESYSCFAGNSIDGPWVQLGTGNATTEFDFEGKISQAQFIKILDDGDGNAYGADVGFDLDAIEVIPHESGVYLLIDQYLYADTSGNNNGIIDPDENISVNVTLRNNGSLNAESITGTLSYDSSLISLSTTELNFIDLQQGQSDDAAFEIYVKPNAQPEDAFHIIMDVLVDGAYENTFVMTFIVGELIEDWETGDFQKFNWAFEGNANWLMETSDVYEGTYSARSGVIGNSQSSSLYINLDVIADGNISFYKKVSSEANYDYLQFYIDNEMKGQWSGNTSWQQVSYPVSSGNHTFKWVYIKDTYTVAGMDRAWIDYIEFPPVIPSGSGFVAFATAANDTICRNDSAQLNAIAVGGSGNYTFNWTPETGLNDPNIQNPLASPDQNTTYIVTIDDGNQILIDSVIIYPLDVPDAPVITSEIQPGGVLLHSNQVENNQWYKDHLIIAGATEQEYFADESGLYYARINNGPCFSDTSNIFEYNVGIENFEDASLILYPNPMSKEVFISQLPDESCFITITDIYGKIILNKKFHYSSNTLNVELPDSMSDGIYFLSIKTSSFNTIRKIIKNE